MHDAESSRRPATGWYAVRHGFLWPALFSILLAATPGDLVILMQITLGALCILALARGLDTGRVRWNIAGLVVTVACLHLWAWLPVKDMDRKVQPFAYEEMSLMRLCERLENEQHIPVSVLDQVAQGRTLALSVTRPMSRREVMQKLADETGLCWRACYCGTGATLLWGMHLLHINLEPR